jgi:hypothetical protein
MKYYKRQEEMQMIMAILMLSFAKEILRGISVEDNTADLVISSCVINLTSDKVATFRDLQDIEE